VTCDPAEVPCTLVNTAHQLPELEKALADAERVAIDTEVPVRGPNAHRLRVMSVAVRAADSSERAFVVDGRDVDVTKLGPILTGVTADAWNASFDARVIDAAVWNSTDTTPGLTWWDAQLGDALIHQGRSGFTWYHGLAWATDHYLGIAAQGKGDVQLSYTAHDDLTPQQVAYAAADAVETLWVGDAIRRAVREAGLERICEIEMRARPFLDQMERSGLPFDWEGWQHELERIERQNREVTGELAALTGGGQGTLFDDIVEPNWNPASDRQVRQALNRWAEDRVLAWTSTRYGAARPLTDDDSVTAAVLREIGGDLCDTLLRFRNLTKVLSTYGDSILEHLDDDGRLRPQYLQVVGTNTGRLASRNPNAQNFTPLMKPYVRPPSGDRVFVHADLSQAELRYLAQVADDEPLREAFARGDDVHATTAASMFGFDEATLQRDDPDRFKHLRQIAKALNFGIAYGSGAAALARSLTAEGSATTVDEASKLLAQYRRTYPGTAAWAEARIAEIDAIRDETVDIDWTVTMRLARGFTDVASIRRQFRKDRHRWPTAPEIAALHPDQHRSDETELIGEVDWLLRYSAPVALLETGEPFTFASRTSSGRRQQFNLHLDRLFLAAAIDILRNSSPELVAVRRRFEYDHSIILQDDRSRLSDAELARPFEDRALRRRFIDAVSADLGSDVAHRYLARAAKERVSAMVNAWRNAPIQGGVADIMLVAYADLHRRLDSYVTAKPVQTVHDSIVIECSPAEASMLVDDVRDALEAATRQFCPDVVPKADVDIRRSLAEADIIAPDKL
jgi:DNA polymerase I-like protein with 3'-5' exonuclease and polymerase domains